ncbi:MAG TPA: DUF4252 domain-containing protein [Blastocatellia bacterium]|nr:DUF4252 domain-containing protein [Blastocatellia bacterium]
MKLAVGRAGKLIGVILWLVIGSALTTRAQDAKLEISQLDKLAAKAAEAVEVSLDEKLLRLAARILSDKNPDEAKVKELILALKGVYVRVFEFDKAGEYSEADLEPLRSQLRAPGWSRIVGVRSRRGGENVDVFTRMQGDNIVGLAIIAAEPEELTVVNIVGPIDLEKLSQLEGHLGIPRLGIGRHGKSKKE